MATLRELAIRVTADATSYQREMSRASRLGTDYYKTMEERSRRLDAYIASNNRSIQAMNAHLHSLKSSALGLASAFVGDFNITSIINAADDWGQLAVRVESAVQSIGGSISDYEAAQERLLAISNRNAKNVEDSQELFIATASSMRDLGYATNETLDFIEAMTNSYTLNAVAADKVQSSINIINKAMITGKVTGKQFQDLMSSTPNIASALANSLEKDERRIKSLGLNGQISMRQLADAMIKVKDETGKLVDDMGVTGRDGKTIISNNFKQLIGEINRSLGATKKLANGLIFIADNIKLIGTAGAGLAAVGLSRYFGRLSDSVINATKTTLDNRTAQISLAQIQLAGAKTLQAKAVAEVNAARFEAQRAVGLKANLIAQNNLTAAIDRQTLANNKLALAQSKVDALTSKMGLLSRAGSGLLGLLGGPLGLAMTALSVGAAFFTMSDGVKEAKKPIEDLQLPIDQLIEKYKNLDKSRQAVLKTDVSDDVKDKTKAVELEIPDLKEALKKSLSDVKPTGLDYPKVKFDLSSGNEKEIETYIEKITSLIAKVKDGTLPLKEFSDQFYEANGQLNAATLNSKSFEKTLIEMTRGTLESAIALAEQKEKLDAIEQVSREAANGVKQLDLVDFPNLDNQLATLNQELITNEAKTKYGAEAAFVLAGLQRAAGNAALEHSDSLVELAVKQKLSGNMSEELGKKLTELARKLRENFRLQEKFKHSGTSLSPADLYKSQLVKLNNQIDAYTDITELQKLRRQLAEGELSKLSETQKKMLEIKAVELDQLNAKKEYKSILDSLRSPTEQQFDTYKQQLEVLEKGNFSLKEREELLDKINKKSMESLPTSSYQNSYNGLGSDLLNVFEDEKRLIDWKEQQLKIQSDLLNKKKIKHEEYAQAVISIEDTMQKKQKDIQDAYTLATLGTFSSLTGSIADMFKETAGESSAAYKAMFLASKASAIAQATISTLVAANKAREMGEPHGEIAASIVMGLGMANVGLIASQTIVGMAHSGIDYIPKEGTWLLDKGERVLDARTNSDLRNFLKNPYGFTKNASPALDASTNANLRSRLNSTNMITVNVPVSVGNSEFTEGEAKELGNVIRETVLSVIDNEMRPGGKLNRR